MIAKLEGTWKVKLDDMVNSSSYKGMMHSLNKEYDDYSCYPAKNEVFKAFELCPFESVKVVASGAPSSLLIRWNAPIAADAFRIAITKPLYG